MAVTQLSDVYVPEVVEPYMTERTAEVNAFLNSGAVVQSEEFDQRASQKGKLVDIPFFKDLGRGDIDGFDSEQHQDGTDLSLTAREASNQIAVKNRRAKAWAATDIVRDVIKEDPLEDIGNLLAAYWGGEIELTALFQAIALFHDDGPLGINSDNPHIVKVGAEDGEDASGVGVTGSDEDGDPILESMNKLGEKWDSIEAVGLHPDKFLEMQKANVIEYEPLSEAEITVPRFMGREVVVDSSVPKFEAEDDTNPHDRYLTILFGEGAFAYGEGSPSVPSEVERDATTNGGQETFVSRRHYVVHPNGIDAELDISGDTPTASELKDESDYDLVYEHKNVNLAAVESN